MAAVLVTTVACTSEGTDSVPTAEGFSQPDGEPQRGGTVTFGHDREPTTMNPITRDGQVLATTMVARTVLAGAYRVTPEFEYVPELLDGEAETSGGDGDEPFAVTWTLREDVEWSDGEPLTARDLQFTYETMMNEGLNVGSRAGYELITDTEVVDPRTWRAEFSEPYAPYRSLFSGNDAVLPAHVLEGEDFGAVWRDGIIDPATGEGIASGPFVFQAWERGESLTVTRNERYWGEPAMLDEITWTWAESSAALMAQLDRGEIDVARPAPRPSVVARARQLDDVGVQTTAGPAWEQLAFNFDTELLARGFVRKAIIQAIDRDALVEEVVGDVHPEARVLQNAIYQTNHPEYTPHWDRWGHDPEAATALLEENGCTREGDADEEGGGPAEGAGTDGVFTCDGEALSFRFVGMTGVDRRERIFERVEEQLAEVGIEARPDFGAPRDTLGRKLPDGDFELANFGWTGGPDPSGGDPIFVCDGELNYADYCNEDVSELIDDNTNILDEAERAEAYNEADELLAEDVALVPLFQVPVVLTFHEDVGGLRANPTGLGPTWNADDWYRAG